MAGSPLDDFATISRALQRLSDAYRQADADAHGAELGELRARYPSDFQDLPAFSLKAIQNDLNALLSAGSGFAGRSTGPLVEHARARYRQGAFRDAARAYALALLIAPTSAQATVMYASAMEMAHPRANHLTPARWATVLAPLGADCWKLAMRGSFGAGRMGAAEAQGRRHVILAPASFSGWFVIARARFRRGQADSILSLLRRAETLSPKNLHVQRALIRCQFRLGHFAGALIASDQAATLGASGPAFEFERARIARSAGETDLANRLLDQLEAADPTYKAQRRILELTATVDDLRASPR